MEVSASYDAPPNLVKAVIREALRDDPDMVAGRDPEVLLVDFADSAVKYRVRFWISDFEADERVKDRVRSLTYYAFKRHGITIPYPIQVQMSTAEANLVPPAAGVDEKLLFAVPMFSSLSDQERAELLKVARPVAYAAGEIVVRQGDEGGSLFAIRRGDVSVRLAGADGRVAHLHAGDVFGEMSLLTGEKRSATVAAETDCDLLEIEKEGFRRLVLANPSMLQRVTEATAARRQELNRHRDEHSLPTLAADTAQSLMSRVKHFLRL